MENPTVKLVAPTSGATVLNNKSKVEFKTFKLYTPAEDSYKLVEAPYLGMEHQSSVTYGNGYQNGYRGRDLSGTGWGLKFDFIIIHELIN